MKNLLSSLLIALALSFVAACGGGPSAAGVYQLDTAPFRIMLAAEMNDAPPDVAKEQIDKMIAGMSGSFDLKADGTAAMKMAMMGMNEETTGTWKLDGGTITLTAKGKDGKDQPKTAKYADGVITIDEDRNGKKMSMVFRRK